MKAVQEKVSGGQVEKLFGVLDARDASAIVRNVGADKILAIYKIMSLNRTIDNKILSLQRQGRVGAYIASTGEEGTSVGAACATEKTDWMISSYRETGAHLARGLSVDLMLAQLFGNSNDLLKGRQMSNSWGSRQLNNIPTAAPIGAYLPMAVGVAMAAKLRNEKVGVLTFMGDGGTSSSDFHTAMNFAGVFSAPVVFVCRNNGWAISLPVSRQTASESMAIKAVAYGFPGILVDGNDPLAVYLEVSKAMKRAKKGDGPTFIEARTYRIGPHSTADDPNRYRNNDEVQSWKQKDPISRLKKFMVEQGLWNENAQKELEKDLERQVSDAVGRQEGLEPLAPEKLLFDDVYATMSWFLVEQKDDLLDYLNGR